MRRSRLNQVIDEIHQQFGFTKLVYATSLLKGGTAIERASLVGGHNGRYDIGGYSFNVFEGLFVNFRALVQTV